MASPNRKADRDSKRHDEARAVFRITPKEKLPELPPCRQDVPAAHASSSASNPADIPSTANSSKRCRSVVEAEDHTMTNAPSAEELRRAAHAAYFAEQFPPLLESDDESGPANIVERPKTRPPKGKGRADPVPQPSSETVQVVDNEPATSAKRPRTRSPKGKGRARSVVGRPVKSTASDEDDEAEDDQPGPIAAAGPETMSPKGKGKGKGRADPVSQSSPDVSSDHNDDADDGAGAANVPAAMTKKQKRKRTSETDAGSAPPRKRASEPSSTASDDVQPPSQRKKHKKGKSVDAVVSNTTVEERSSDMPTESSTFVVSDDRELLPADEPIEISTGESSASAALAGASSLGEKKKGKKSKKQDTSVVVGPSSFVENAHEEVTASVQDQVCSVTGPCPSIIERADTSSLSSLTTSRPSWPKRHAKLNV
jgi:hypothetical protein